MIDHRQEHKRGAAPNMAITPKVNYLTNKELLSEIHKSKNSFSYFVDPKYSSYDCIIGSLDEINLALIQTVRESKAKKMMQADKLGQKELGLKNHQIKVEEVDPLSIPVQDIVWRVMTHEHIPLEEGRVKNPKTVAEHHVRLNFPPFKHYIITEDDGAVEVGRSHWKNALDNGEFSQTHGKISNRLALMFMKLVERYSQRGNWRGYTYVDEMRSQALLQLSLVGLQFNEARSDNPFAYYTVTVSNAFTRVLNLEKRNQNIRDDMLIMHGVTPSITRQIDNSLSQRALANGEVPEQKKLVRKTSPGNIKIEAVEVTPEEQAERKARVTAHYDKIQAQDL
jgi:hypothetical protein